MYAYLADHGERNVAVFRRQIQGRAWTKYIGAASDDSEYSILLVA